MSTFECRIPRKRPWSSLRRPRKSLVHVFEACDQGQSSRNIRSEPSLSSNASLHVKKKDKQQYTTAVNNSWLILVFKFWTFTTGWYCGNRIVTPLFCLISLNYFMYSNSLNFVKLACEKYCQLKHNFIFIMIVTLMSNAATDIIIYNLLQPGSW